ncbi:MAG TPA: hypothetical protein PK397_14195 [Ignavibacteriaceae bacterium]|jgi:hypothetical protein|nr:hypothetical protein [Ignavibacteriaceae bacterium]
MPRAKQIVRKYNIPDADMISEARNKLTAFNEDKAGFISYDPDFRDPFSTDFESLINEGESTPDDEMIKGEMLSYTNRVDTALENCRVHFQEMKYFIEKAFPTDYAKQTEFGYRMYEQVRLNHDKMVQFMRNLFDTAKKYETDLTAVNYTADKIARIDTLRLELIDADKVQDNYIKNRPVYTQNRVIAMNRIWDGLVKICNAGKNIFRNDYAKLQKYDIPTPKVSSTANDEPQAQ